nr:MAG TPA: hypothetical protein [Caudoviricetes sp.]
MQKLTTSRRTMNLCILQFLTTYRHLKRTL